MYVCKVFGLGFRVHEEVFINRGTLIWTPNYGHPMSSMPFFGVPEIVPLIFVHPMRSAVYKALLCVPLWFG